MSMIAPDDLKIGHYAERWNTNVLRYLPSITKQRDFHSCLNNQILPCFGERTFSQLTRIELKIFVAKLTHRSGPNIGKPLSRGRCTNIISVLRALWEDACNEFGWHLPDPFQNISKTLPCRNKSRRPPEIFRFADWEHLLSNMDPYYRTVAEFMLRTGMTATEIGQLAKCDIRPGVILANHRLEKHTVIAQAKIREIPITSSMQTLIDRALKSSPEEILFNMKNGANFNGERFRKSVWRKACDSAGIELRPIYSIRNSFAAWSLAIGIHPIQLAQVMGLSSPQVLYERMGLYTASLKPDAENIRNYFGSDFHQNDSGNYSIIPTPKDSP